MKKTKKFENPGINLNDIPDDVFEKILDMQTTLMKNRRRRVSAKEAVFKLIRQSIITTV